MKLNSLSNINSILVKKIKNEEKRNYEIVSFGLEKMKKYTLDDSQALQEQLNDLDKQEKIKMKERVSGFLVNMVYYDSRWIIYTNSTPNCR